MVEGIAGLLLIGLALLLIRLRQAKAELNKLSEFASIILLDREAYESCAAHMTGLVAALREDRLSGDKGLWALRAAQIDKATRYIDDTGGLGNKLLAIVKDDATA